MRFSKHFHTKSIFLGTSVLLAALILASCGSAKAARIVHSHVTPIATETPVPTSLCDSEGDYVKQSFNGDFTGCIRVPALDSSSLIVALQAYLNGPTKPVGPTTTTSPPEPIGKLVLKLSTYDAKPGAMVTITGHYSKQPPSPRQSLVNICWDGCLTGLQESGQLHWTSHTSFRTKFQVPETAWLVNKHGAVSVHPLSSGHYQVGVQCIGAISGCAYSHADAQATIDLKAPRAKHCVKGEPCETMQLSVSKAKVGSIVTIKGWAPLQNIIGQPFGWQYSITSGSLKTNYPALTYNVNQKGGGYNVVLTPRALHVTPSPTWASLGHVAYISSSFAGPSSVQPASNSNLIAWCQTSGLEVTGGSSLVDVPTTDVAAALRGTPLALFGGPACSTVLLDPTYHDSIYAGFNTAVGHSAPPIYIAGLYTTNDGATWRTVPAPAGDTVEDFSGFVTEGSRVAALFADPNSYYTAHEAPGTKDGLVSAEVTDNGGSTWTSSTLGCPNTGPCTTFGPYQWGNCDMNGSPQPLLQGPTGSTATSGVRFGDTSWSSTLNSCFSQQLVVSSSSRLFLLDATSQYPLQESTTSGRTWFYVSVPQISVANYNDDYTPLGNALVLAPDGSLFALVAPASTQREDLFRLYPGASRWCEVPNVFPGNFNNVSIGPLRVAGADLVWNELNYSGTERSSKHVEAFNHLSC